MKIFKLNYEYFTFISGALISLAISLMFEIFKATNKAGITLCILSTIAMTFSSVLCFILSLRTKTLQEDFKDNMATKEATGLKGEEAKKSAWNKTIRVAENSKRLNLISVSAILLMLFTILTCIGSMILYYFSLGGN